MNPKIIYRYIRRFIQPYPDQINLQLVSTCNLRCKHCQLSLYGNEISDGKLTVLSYDECVKQIDCLRPVIKKSQCLLLSMFETLIHKDVFKIMDYTLTINPNIQFPILTNCKVVNDRMIKKLEEYPLFEFLVSLDGARKETVESFKTGSSYDQIIKVIKKALDSSFSEKVGTVLVLHERNKKELLDYLDLVASLGIKKVYLNNLLAFTTQFRNAYLYRPEGNAEIEKLFSECKGKARELGIELWLPSLKPRLIGCRTSEYLNVDWQGNVIPCDFLGVQTPFELFGELKQNKEPIIFGNIYNDNPLKVYRSKAYKNFRLMHRFGNIPEPCSHCIDAYGLMCSQRCKT